MAGLVAGAPKESGKYKHDPAGDKALPYSHDARGDTALPYVHDKRANYKHDPRGDKALPYKHDTRGDVRRSRLKLYQYLQETRPSLTSRTLTAGRVWPPLERFTELNSLKI